MLSIFVGFCTCKYHILGTCGYMSLLTAALVSVSDPHNACLSLVDLACVVIANKAKYPLRSITMVVDIFRMTVHHNHAYCCHSQFGPVAA